jgi:hypothetical protein
MRTVSLGLVLVWFAGAGCEQSATATPDASPGAQVIVTYHGTDHPVEVGAVTPVTLDGGVAAVPLAAVVLTALPDTALSAVAASFLAADGFDPVSKATCAALLPVPGELLARVTLDPATLNLSWAEDLQYPGCLYVKGLARVTLSDR